MAGSLRYRRIKHFSFNAPSLQCKSTVYTVFLCTLQWLTRQYNVEKAASNSCILNIEYMATLWVHVQCRTWQDRLHIVGLTLVSYRASNILCNGSPLYLGPARSHFLLYIPMQNIVANTTISRWKRNLKESYIKQIVYGYILV